MDIVCDSKAVLSQYNAVVSNEATLIVRTRVDVASDAVTCSRMYIYMCVYIYFHSRSFFILDRYIKHATPCFIFIKFICLTIT